MKTILKIIFLCMNLIVYGNFLPIEEPTILPFIRSYPEIIEYKRMFDELDAQNVNNFDDLSWVNKDENDTELLNYQMDKPFSMSDHVGLFLFVKKNPDTPYLLNLQNSKNAPININHRTIIIIHGWRSSGNSTEAFEAKNSFIKAGDYNVIVVDYAKYAYLLYPIACKKGSKVGAYIGQVLVSLYEHNKIRLEDIHIFGASLGGHVSGFVGKAVKSLSGKKVGRITGLDPAGPVFEIPVLLEKEKRLYKDDALFTDIIHTGGGALGFRQSLGHADFYPNGGSPVQPGCGNEIFPFMCSHIISGIFYEESITTDKFLATPCSSWQAFKQGQCDGLERVSMGHHLDVTKARGKYYLYTNEISPHALG